MALSTKLSIRTNLAMLVGVCLVPTILAAAGILVYHYQRARDQQIIDAVSTARLITNSVDFQLSTVQTTLEVLATSSYLQNLDVAAFYAQATEVQTRSLINNIVFIAPSGQQLVNTALPLGKPLPKIKLTEVIARAFATGRTQLSGLEVGVVVKRPLVYVAVPVRSAGAVSHVLVGIVRAKQLQTIIDKALQPSDRIVVIFDKFSIIALRSHEAERFVGQSIAPTVAARLKVMNEGAMETRSLEGIDVVVAFSRSATTGWGAAVAIPRGALTAALYSSMWHLAVITGLVVCLGLGLAWQMGGRISRAVEKLMQSALDLAQGKAVQVSKLAFREAEALGKALVQTSEVLESTANALKSNESRMRSILQSALDAIITVDDDQNVVLFNAAASDMFGWSLEEAMGKPITVFIPERFHAQHFAYVRKNRASSEGAEVFGVAGEAVGLRSGGEEFPIEVSYSNVVGPDGTFHTLIIRDITSRVKSFKALERSNLDLQQFAYVASHDLKTPLRSISGFVQILERNYADKLDDKALSLIRRTSQAATRLEQLTDDLLSFARVNSNPKPFELVHSREVVEETIQLLDASIHSKGASVTVGDLPEVMGDRSQLVQLFLNLIGNGLKYCQGRAPVVHVSAERNEHEWVFAVADNGIGIDPKHHQKIFEIFKRLHTQTEYAGTGIGLAVCHRIVERHHGRIWVESSPGVGSTFYFTLPIESEQVP